MKEKNFFYIVVVLALVALTLLGYYTFYPNHSEKAETKNITTVRYAQLKVFDPTFVAKDLGYFAEEGINVEFVGEQFGGPQVVTAVSTGNADAGIAALTAIINAKSAGANVKGVLDVQTAFSDAPLGIWYTLNDSGIKGPADLKGKKIGINTLGASFHYSTVEMLKKYNMTEKDVTFTIIPHPNLEQSLRSKAIDVAGMIDPYTMKASLGGGLTEVFNQYNATGNTQFSVIFFSEDFMKNNSEVMKGYIRAYNKAVNYIKSNPANASEIMSAHMGVGKEFVAPHKFTENAAVDNRSVQFWIDALVENGKIEKGKITSNSIFTNEYQKK